jgi:hypothetical protein
MSKDKVTQALIEALHNAQGVPEVRLYRAGKLQGLFPGKTGVHAEAASRAIAEGLLEVVRVEVRGKTSHDWVKLTPRGVDFLHAHESPVRALEDLRELLRLNQAALPTWLGEVGLVIAETQRRVLAQVQAWQQKLDELSRRVEATLERLARSRPAIPDDLASVVPWAPFAVAYLDRRRGIGASSPCELPELFGALRQDQQNLTVAEFHDGLRRLHERRVVQLLPAGAELPQPEFALLVSGQMLYSVAI